jgi:hypothetical protein
MDEYGRRLRDMVTQIEERIHHPYFKLRDVVVDITAKKGVEKQNVQAHLDFLTWICWTFFLGALGS